MLASLSQATSTKDRKPPGELVQASFKPAVPPRIPGSYGFSAAEFGGPPGRLSEIHSGWRRTRNPQLGAVLALEFGRCEARISGWHTLDAEL